MGAGKTYLMAAMMYLDLYFAQTEPANKLFAHNFLVLIPSGLKSSIIPSLRSIERFEPSWVIPEPSASDLKRLVKFEVLDEAKTANKSNKAKNPNVQKIARHQPFDTLTGLIMVVNAEKVILERLKLDTQGNLFEERQEKESENELRKFIGKIPNLQIYIDEYHHVPSVAKDSTSGLSAEDEIKLRGVVNGWTNGGTINSVLGFSGTPYLDKSEKIAVLSSHFSVSSADEEDTLKRELRTPNIYFESEKISNTVYYFPLLDGIKTFLKKLEIKSEERGLTSLQIIGRGVQDFRERYANKIYADDTNAKLAIYCGTIERLEAEVYPYLIDELKIDKDKILKYHRGDSKKKFPEPKDSELEFKLLDTPYSRKEIILLVQIGKEGWDCRSLTGVILSQAKDCPKNMVLQTSCRCLRQVEKDKTETALIWLSKDNAETLNKQLVEKQKTSISEINSIGKTGDAEKIERFSRLERLKLLKVDFYQLEIKYQTIFTDGENNPQKQIALIEAEKYFSQGIITERKLAESSDVNRIILDEEKGEHANFNRWLFQVSKESFGIITLKDLRQFEAELKKIFEKITFEEKVLSSRFSVSSSAEKESTLKRELKTGEIFFNAFYNLAEINKKIRLAFHTKRDVEIKSEIIPDSAKMLIVEKLREIAKPRYYYPSEAETQEIIDLDASRLTVEEKRRQQKEAFEKALEILKSQDLESFKPNIPEDFTPAVQAKDKSFHFLPYKFDSSFELIFLKESLKDKYLKDCNLEVYFNGEKDITDFRINCYTDKRKPIGRYTPDFLIVQRGKDNLIHRVLIVETKGEAFAVQEDFKLRRKYVETDFLRINNEKFNYQKFDYLYLEGEMDQNNIVKLNAKLKEFFCN